MAITETQGQRTGICYRAGIFLAALCAAAIWPGNVQAQPAHHDYSDEELYQAAEKIIQWKKDDTGAGEYLLEGQCLKSAGSTQGDWYTLSLGRLGRKDDYTAYLAVAGQNVEERYQTKEKLDAAKATEWHRISLAILAAGGDPTDVGESHIDLIADGTYNRGKTESLGAQGVNGIIWGLLTLDSLRYQVPEDAHDSREDILVMLLEQQQADGGFAFSGDTAEPDITAMALDALAPYRNDETVYTYTQKAVKKKVSKTPGQVIEESLDCLAGLQGEGGGYQSWGSENSESASQMITALSALGIDLASDQRFIKNGITLLDVLMDFQMSDGGFLHSREYDEENQSADPNESNTLASEQALYALTAYLRFHGSLRSLFDCREEMAPDVKAQVQAARTAIEELPQDAGASLLQAAYETYNQVPASERSYVYNYHKLSRQMKESGLHPQSASMRETMELYTSGRGTQVDIRRPEHVLDTEITFTEEDRQAAEAIPEDVTAEHEVPVLKALYQMEKSGAAAEDRELAEGLRTKKEAIQKKKEEIRSLNNQIKEQISGADSFSIKDRKLVESIKTRYTALSPYEQGLVEGYEDVARADLKISNTVRGIAITCAAVLAAGILLAVVFLRGRKRRQEKRNRKMLDWEEDE